MSKIRVSAVQFSYKPINSFHEFESNVKQLLDQAKNSDFVIFPETFTFELQYLIPNYEIGRIHEFTDQYIELFSELAQKTNQYIVAGSHLTKIQENRFNTCYFFKPDGEYFTHNKTHLFPLEGATGITPGDRIEIFETDKAKVGITICYEIEFPEVVRILTLKGAEIIFCPSYTVDEYGFWRVRHCCQARAIENQIYVVHSCLVGTPPLTALAGWGRTSILSPCELPWPQNGVIVEAKTNEEMVIHSDLNIKLIHRKRKRGCATPLKDRRPEIYSEL